MTTPCSRSRFGPVVSRQDLPIRERPDNVREGSAARRGTTSPRGDVGKSPRWWGAAEPWRQTLGLGGGGTAPQLGRWECTVRPVSPERARYSAAGTTTGLAHASAHGDRTLRTTPDRWVGTPHDATSLLLLGSSQRYHGSIPMELFSMSIATSPVGTSVAASPRLGIGKPEWLWRLRAAEP
jgi:hypothetical protein